SSSACSCCSSSVLLVVGVGKPGSVVALSVLAASVIVALVPGVSLDLCQPAVELGGLLGDSADARRLLAGVLPAHLLRRRCVHQSSKLSVCKHLVFLAATRPVQSLQSSHVFYGVDLATPSQPPRRGLVNPSRKMWPRSHRPPSALHPGSVKVESYTPPPALHFTPYSVTPFYTIV